MTREEIVDIYGFDTYNYNHMWGFNYVKRISHSEFHFYEKSGNHQSFLITKFFDGLFVQKGVCDLSYIFGEQKFSDTIVGPHTYYGMIIRHNPSQKYVVIHRSCFKLFPFALGWDRS